MREAFGEDDAVLVQAGPDGGPVGELEGVRPALGEERGGKAGVLPGEDGETEAKETNADLVVLLDLAVEGGELGVEGGAFEGRVGGDGVGRGCERPKRRTKFSP